ncbi:sulfate/molybdate ABC transporter ATP-binding protein [Anaerobacillus sp. MEB173]|uniref:sulfate/molybdate ABC transporter ATP-binding protein n=1 Tax=Anaerobacillus sp. MEB173 TaxID=3383345 RepID=UPI003F9273C2
MLEVHIKNKEENFLLHSSFKAKPGILGILGPSGSGKSLTLQCLAGLRTPDEGSIILNNRVLYDSNKKVNIPPRLRKIGFMFQNYALFPHLNVFDNIAYGLHHLSKTERRKRVSDMLEIIHLSGYENYYPNQLSGGQQQRVALARTLITEPDLLLLDEPFSALDKQIKNKLQLELLDIIQKNYSGVVLLVTHDMDEAYRLCDKIIIYANGKVVQHGNKAEILEQPKTMTVAELTGCKNLFEVKNIIENETSSTVIVNNLHIDVKQKPSAINKNKTFVGIHAHDLRLLTTAEQENTFPCDIIQITDGIFSTSFFVECGGNSFVVDLAKENAVEIKSGTKPLFLHIPNEKVFFVGDDNE